MTCFRFFAKLVCFSRLPNRRYAALSLCTWNWPGTFNFRVNKRRTKLFQNHYHEEMKTILQKTAKSELILKTYDLMAVQNNTK